MHTPARRRCEVVRSSWLLYPSAGCTGSARQADQFGLSLDPKPLPAKLLPGCVFPFRTGSAQAAAASFFNDAVSMTKRYWTSLRSIRS